MKLDPYSPPTSEADIHDPDTCPGWYLTRAGDIEGCVDCGLPDGSMEVYNRARSFFASQPHKPHRDECDCHGCPGYDVFEVTGRNRCPTPFAILRSDDCGVFRGDLEAVAVAVQACVKAGFIVVDGE